MLLVMLSKVLLFRFLNTTIIAFLNPIIQTFYTEDPFSNYSHSREPKN